ncbi:Hemolysin, plasmid [Tepidimonas charontis]|uniref:Hemolysin, plasmid n=2 Tax=Tepidimonas charontis TaxID=2267262 RepID=A0A554WZ90_9BURK|nr:Hemolysin, plasmid [Tepidimonas charontis]
MGDDTLVGTAGNDQIEGLAGNDTLRGAAGDDLLEGGDGADKLYGDAGRDTLYGDSGDDWLQGDDDDDTLHGGSGNDTLHGGMGVDALYGGDGDDKLYDTAPGDLQGGYYDGGAGNDIIAFNVGGVAKGGDGNDRITVEGHVSSLATGIEAGEGADSIILNDLRSPVVIDLTETTPARDTVTFTYPLAVPEQPLIVIKGFAPGSDVFDLGLFHTWATGSTFPSLLSGAGATLSNGTVTKSYVQFLESPAEPYQAYLSPPRTKDDYGKGFFVITGVSAAGTDRASVAAFLDDYGNNASYKPGKSHYFPLLPHQRRCQRHGAVQVHRRHWGQRPHRRGRARPPSHLCGRAHRAADRGPNHRQLLEHLTAPQGWPAVVPNGPAVASVQQQGPQGATKAPRKPARYPKTRRTARPVEREQQLWLYYPGDSARQQGMRVARTVFVAATFHGESNGFIHHRVRIPRHGGHDSMLMADSVPA